MSGINAETTFERNRTRLARGRAFAGGVGLLKLLLLLAPFALFGGCSSQPEVYTGLNLLTISAAALTPLTLFALVPLSALVALAIAVNSSRAAPDRQRDAHWLVASAAASLAALVFVAFFIAETDQRGSGHVTQFLWGFWGLAACDGLTLTLLLTLLHWPAGRST